MLPLIKEKPMRCTLPSGSSFLIMLALFSAARLCAESSTGLPGFQWDRTYGDDLRNEEYKEAIASQDGLWIAGISALTSDPLKSSKLWLWKINAQGERTQNITIKEIEGRTYADVK